MLIEVEVCTSVVIDSLIDVVTGDEQAGVLVEVVVSGVMAVLAINLVSESCAKHGLASMLVGALPDTFTSVLAEARI